MLASIHGRYKLQETYRYFFQKVVNNPQTEKGKKYANCRIIIVKATFVTA